VEHACATLAQRLDSLRRIQLAQLLSPHGTVWQVTEPTPEAAKCLKSLADQASAAAFFTR